MMLSLLPALLLSAGVAAAPAPAPPPPKPAELPHGTLVEKVTCAAQPDQSYALYLPASYRPDRAWPILYAFDARGRALIPAEAFKAAAETYGWILVSSYNTASDGPMEPNFTAMRALWADTHARFKIDDKRVYAAGFSGTVRFSCLLGLSAPGSIAGVIGAGAGFPFNSPPKADNPFAFFGTIGDRDFNYYEVMALDEKMDGLHLPHRIELFDGTHQWPPAPLATQAVAWMELQAMRKGTREKVPALVEPLWTADREKARAQEAAGRLWDARHTWLAMAAGYDGLRDAAEIAGARQHAEEIAARPAFKKEAKERQERIDRDTQLLANAPSVLGLAQSGEPVTVAQVSAQLKIPELLKRAQSSDPEEVLSAKRVLNTILVQTSFYLPQSLAERKLYDRALFMQMIAAEIRPDDAALWANIASTYAQKGDRKKALEALRKAADKGFDNAKVLDDPSFASLRQDETFRQIAAEIARRKPPATPAAGGDS